MIKVTDKDLLNSVIAIEDQWDWRKSTGTWAAIWQLHSNRQEKEDLTQMDLEKKNQLTEIIASNPGSIAKQAQSASFLICAKIWITDICCHIHYFVQYSLHPSSFLHFFSFNLWASERTTLARHRHPMLAKNTRIVREVSINLFSFTKIFPHTIPF